MNVEFADHALAATVKACASPLLLSGSSTLSLQDTEQLRCYSAASMIMRPRFVKPTSY